MQKFAHLSVLTMAVLILLMQPAYAYIDPGTGSLVIQAAAAIILATTVTLRLWIGYAKRFFRRVTGRPADPASIDRS